MTLVLVTTEFNPLRGGIGRFLNDLYQELPAENTMVIDDPGITRPHWLFAVPRIITKLRGISDPVLHVNHVLPLGTIALSLKWLLGIKFVVTLHGMDFFMAKSVLRKRFLLKRILRSAKLVTVNSAALGAEVQEFCGQVNLLVLRPCLSKSMSETKPSFLRQRRPLIVALARFVERKGLETAIVALRYLPEYELVIGGDGPLKKKLLQLVHDFGLKHRVKFVGWIDDAAKIELFQEASVFVLPTKIIGPDREAFGIVYLEAQSFGLPVVAGEGIGVTEALHPKLRSLAVAHTPESVAKAVRLLEKSSPKPEELREYALYFDPKINAGRFWKAVKHAVK
ncbi:MAG: glycosyltransferase family 4 protein [bacterium]